MIKNLLRNLRYDWPLHFALRLTDWLPDNVAVLRLRGMLARPFLGACGRNLRLGRQITFYNPSNLRIGADVYIAYGCWFLAGERITIGDEVLFGPYVVVATSNHTKVGNSFRYGPPEKKPVQIGAGCWIAAHATILAGSIIGEGVLVAAGAVVRGEIPAGKLVGGVPGVVLGDAGVNH